jgi:CxxC-x17-CxxC domain-containing protein
MNNKKEEITFFGLTSFRNQRKRFGIKIDDRRRHFYCIGKTGMGKSNMMENMAIQDIQNGRGIAYVDPHGEGAEKLLDFVPANRINDVIYLNPADLDFPIAFNVMEKVDFRYRHLVAGGLMGVFKKVWPDVWSARMEYILNNSILALLEYPDSTLLGVNRMLADPEYREKVVSKIADPIVKSFWLTEYARYTQRYEIEATAAIQNKVGQFISNPLIRNIIGQTKSTIDMRKIMDEGKILIMNLSKGRIGEDNSRLLGALLITKLQLGAMSRVDILEEKRNDFYLYVDEFQNFATESFANILSEARKYRLSLILGHQYITQMDETVRDAVFGNVGTLIVFRIGAEDAEFLEKEFAPELTAQDLVSLPKYNIYLKLMIDGIAGNHFSAETLPPPEAPEKSNKEKIIRASQERYGVKKETVEDKISRWSGTAEDKKKSGGFNDLKRENKSSGYNKTAENSMQNEQPVLYDAVCFSCGKPTKVIFQPEKGRPVYCKSCLKKMKEGSAEHVLPRDNYHDQRKEEVLTYQNSQEQKKDSLHPDKIEEISFRSSQKKTEKNTPDNKPVKKREVNLSELKKALEESLEEIKEESAPKNADKKTEETEEKTEKKEINPTEEIDSKKDINPPDTGEKKIIKPGEKIRL